MYFPPIEESGEIKPLHSSKGRGGEMMDCGVIQKLKALHDDGQGLSIHVIGQELGI
tara:strand:- start:10194 stop:10361 length:168 start_codon:yes stop_codon:yes gene_type:complete